LIAGNLATFFLDAATILDNDAPLVRVFGPLRQSNTKLRKIGTSDAMVTQTVLTVSIDWDGYSLLYQVIGRFLQRRFAIC
jgi:hypothetical protein